MNSNNQITLTATCICWDYVVGAVLLATYSQAATMLLETHSGFKVPGWEGMGVAYASYSLCNLKGLSCYLLVVPPVLAECTTGD